MLKFEKLELVKCTECEQHLEGNLSGAIKNLDTYLTDKPLFRRIRCVCGKSYMLNFTKLGIYLIPINGYWLGTTYTGATNAIHINGAFIDIQPTDDKLVITKEGVLIKATDTAFYRYERSEIEKNENLSKALQLLNYRLEHYKTYSYTDRKVIDALLIANGAKK